MVKSMSDKRCPKCGGPVVNMDTRLYRCDNCKMLTDCEDDGDIGYKSQERYAERKEEYELRQAARRNQQQRKRR